MMKKKVASVVGAVAVLGGTAVVAAPPANALRTVTVTVSHHNKYDARSNCNIKQRAYKKKYAIVKSCYYAGKVYGPLSYKYKFTYAPNNTN